MTLIAAYRVQDTPVLLGDFRTTVVAAREVVQFGGRRKLIILGPSVAVGFTGSVTAAEKLFADLLSYIGTTVIALPELERLLAGYDVEALDGKVSIVGWIGAAEPICFRWDSVSPTRCSRASHHYAGSGARWAEKTLGPHPSSPIEGYPASPESAAKLALTAACRLVAAEELGAPFSAERFGAGYEAIFWNGTSFEYVSDVLFLMLAAEIDPTGRAEGVRILPTMFKYATDGDYAIYQTSRSDSGQISRNVLSLPLPINAVELDSTCNRIMARDYVPLSLAARYHAVFVHLVRSGEDNSSSIPPLLAVFDEANPDPHVSFSFAPKNPSDLTNGILTLGGARSLVDWAAGMIHRHQGRGGDTPLSA